MNMTIRRSPNRNNHKARNSSVSRRVDKSLGYVADQMAFALGSHCAGQESQLLCRRLALRELRYLPYLELKYHFENRLMAISYNLELSTEIPTGSQFQEWGTCSFTVRQQGREAQWIYLSGKEGPELDGILREHDWFCDLDIGSAGGEPYQTQRGGVPSLCGIF